MATLAVENAQKVGSQIHEISKQFSRVNGLARNWKNQTQKLMNWRLGIIHFLKTSTQLYCTRLTGYHDLPSLDLLTNSQKWMLWTDRCLKSTLRMWITYCLFIHKEEDFALLLILKDIRNIKLSFFSHKLLKIKIPPTPVPPPPVLLSDGWGAGFPGIIKDGFDTVFRRRCHERSLESKVNLLSNP